MWIKCRLLLTCEKAACTLLRRISKPVGMAKAPILFRENLKSTPSEGLAARCSEFTPVLRRKARSWSVQQFFRIRVHSTAINRLLEKNRYIIAAIFDAVSRIITFVSNVLIEILLAHECNHGLPCPAQIRGEAGAFRYFGFSKF